MGLCRFGAIGVVPERNKARDRFLVCFRTLRIESDGEGTAGEEANFIVCDTHVGAKVAGDDAIEYGYEVMVSCQRMREHRVIIVLFPGGNRLKHLLIANRINDSTPNHSIPVDSPMNALRWKGSPQFRSKSCPREEESRQDQEQFSLLRCAIRHAGVPPGFEVGRVLIVETIIAEDDGRFEEDVERCGARSPDDMGDQQVVEVDLAMQIAPCLPGVAQRLLQHARGR